MISEMWLCWHPSNNTWVYTWFYTNVFTCIYIKVCTWINTKIVTWVNFTVCAFINIWISFQVTYTRVCINYSIIFIRRTNLRLSIGNNVISAFCVHDLGVEARQVFQAPDLSWLCLVRMLVESTNQRLMISLRCNDQPSRIFSKCLAAAKLARRLRSFVLYLCCVRSNLQEWTLSGRHELSGSCYSKVTLMAVSEASILSVWEAFGLRKVI